MFSSDSSDYIRFNNINKFNSLVQVAVLDGSGKRFKCLNFKSIQL